MSNISTTPAKPARKRVAKQPTPTVPTYDTSDGTAVDAEALSGAASAIHAALKAGAAAFIKAGGFAHTVAAQIVAARLAITLQSGMPDFGGTSAAWLEVKAAVIDPFYAGLDKTTRGQLQSRVSTALQAHLDSAIGQWTLQNREGMPKADTLNLSGPKQDVQPGDAPRIVLDPPVALKREVAKVYAAANLKPEIGRWGRQAEPKVDKGTQAKLVSAPLNVTEAAAEVASSKVAVDAAAESVRELATALLSAILAAKQIGADKRDAGEKSCLQSSRIMLACGKALNGKWEGDADAAAIADALYVAPTS